VHRGATHGSGLAVLFGTLLAVFVLLAHTVFSGLFCCGLVIARCYD
jgi:hypothetical protein